MCVSVYKYIELCDGAEKQDIHVLVGCAEVCV